MRGFFVGLAVGLGFHGSRGSMRLGLAAGLAGRLVERQLTVTFQGNHRAFGPGLGFPEPPRGGFRGFGFVQEQMCLELVKNRMPF